MSTKTYNRLRIITQIILPSLATFIVTFCGVWKVPYGKEIGTTVSAIVTLFSGILGASSAIYDKERKKKNGNNIDNSSNNMH